MPAAAPTKTSTTTIANAVTEVAGCAKPAATKATQTPAKKPGASLEQERGRK